MEVAGSTGESSNMMQAPVALPAGHCDHLFLQEAVLPPEAGIIPKLEDGPVGGSIDPVLCDSTQLCGGFPEEQSKQVPR